MSDLFLNYQLIVWLRISCIWMMAVLTLSSCGVNSSSPIPAISRDGAVSEAALAGQIIGGRQPIVGSVVYVFAASITNSVAPTQIGTAVTGSDGTFSIASWSRTPVDGDLIYLFAVGGDAGGGVNPTIALMSLAGVWGDAHFISHVQVNELTTIAFISQFTNYIAKIPCSSITGSTATTGNCPRILGEVDWSVPINNVASLVDVSTGKAAVALQVATYPSAAYVTYQNLNLQASVLANCVNSSGGVAGDGSACGNLLGLASSQSPVGILTVNALPVAAGAAPAGITISHDGQFAYVSNYGDNTISTLRIANDGTLSVFGSPTTVGVNPYASAISNDGQFLFVSNSGSDTLSTIHIGANGRLDVIGQPVPAGRNPGAIAFTPDGRFMFVTSAGDGKILTYSVLNGSLSMLGQPLQVGINPVSIVVSADGKSAYVSDSDGFAIVSLIISDGNLHIANSINLEQGPYSMAISPNGKYSVVANFNNASFSVFSITQSVLNLITPPITDSSRLTDIVFSVDGQFFYVVDSGQQYTETFSIDQNGNVTQIGDTVPGILPWSIAISPNGQFAYVTNLNDASVSSFRISTGTPTDTWSAIANLQANPTNTAVALFALAPSPAVYGPMPSNTPLSLTLP